MILFCEYVIMESGREAFLDWVQQHPERWTDAELAENTAQPGVFVELRRVRDEEEGAEITKERREGRSGWQAMEAWVKGGRDGIRIWMFRPLALQAAD